MILLDSSVLIEMFRKQKKEETLFFNISKSNSELAISAITYYEVGIGNRKAHSDYWKELSEKLIVLPFDKICSDTAIKVYLELLRKNKMIDLADIFIGATALANEVPLATLNYKHFERIPNLNFVK